MVETGAISSKFWALAPWQRARRRGRTRAPCIRSRSRRRPCAIPDIANGRPLALAEAKRLGCSYADIRFTRNRSQSLTIRNGQIFGGQGRFGGDGFGGRGGGGTVETYGFGIRVIHGGVWGFASSPLVTPEEIKRVAGVATDIARASAVAKKTDVRLAPVEKYDEYRQMPFEKDPWSVPLEEKVELLRGVTAAIQKTPGILFATAVAGFEYEWKYLATSEGSFIEQLFHFCNCSAAATARTGTQVKTRNYERASGGGYEFLVKSNLPGQAERIAAEAIEHSKAKPVGQGVKDLDPAALASLPDDPRDRRACDRARSHRRLRGELRRHQLREAQRSRQAEIRVIRSSTWSRTGPIPVVWRLSGSTMTA